MKIMLVDEHSLFMKDIAHMLNKLSDSVHVLTVNSYAYAIEIANQVNQEKYFDLLLLDLFIPNDEGIQTLGLFVKKMPFCPVVIISGSLNLQNIQSALDHGAMGYISKTVAPEVMLNALSIVLSGGMYIPQEFLDRYKTLSRYNIMDTRCETQYLAFAATPDNTLDINLTPRQREVLKLLVMGKVNKVIANELNCAEATVKAHITALFKALGASNRTHATWIVENIGLRL